MSRIPCYRRDVLTPSWQISSPIGPMKRINVGLTDEGVEAGERLTPDQQLKTILEENWRVFDSEVTVIYDQKIPGPECFVEVSYTFACHNVTEMHPIIVAQFSNRFPLGLWPTVAAYQTAMNPEGKEWGGSAVALQSAVFYNQQAVDWLYIEEDQKPANRCFVPEGESSAMVVDTGDSRELFCSLILPIAGTPGNYRLVDALAAGQTHTCLMYCNELLTTGSMAYDNVDQVDVFYRSGIQAGTIVQQVQNFYRDAVIIATPVSQLPIETCSVGIRPHAVAWK